MAEYIDIDGRVVVTDTRGRERETTVRSILEMNKGVYTAADVLPLDEGIKLGAELAAMHGATPEQQQLEEAYLKGVEYGMKRRDVRPVVRAYWKSVPHKRARVCSRCEADEPYKFADDDANVYDFCPNCGADMREEADV